MIARHEVKNVLPGIVCRKMVPPCFEELNLKKKIIVSDLQFAF